MAEERVIDTIRLKRLMGFKSSVWRVFLYEHSFRLVDSEGAERLTLSTDELRDSSIPSTILVGSRTGGSGAVTVTFRSAAFTERFEAQVAESERLRSWHATNVGTLTTVPTSRVCPKCGEQDIRGKHVLWIGFVVVLVVTVVLNNATPSREMAFFSALGILASFLTFAFAVAKSVAGRYQCVRCSHRWR